MAKINSVKSDSVNVSGVNILETLYDVGTTKINNVKDFAKVV